MGGEGSARLRFVDLLAPAALEGLEARGRPVRFQADSTLLHQGEPGDRTLLIRSGHAKITYVGSDGRQTLLRLCGPGDLVGELSVLDDEPRSSSVTALDPVEGLVLSGRDFIAALHAHPDAAVALLRDLSRRFRDANLKRIEFGASDAVGRVAARLLELAAMFGEPSDAGIEVSLPILQEELAGWCGCSREAVVKALHSLRELGWIETGRKRVTIVDEGALEQRAA
jgi:CRP/FNR family cyclic AMP-dependent transcriptional regulator